MPIRIIDNQTAASFPASINTNPLIVDYFAGLPESQRDAAFERALTIGVMALRHDRIAAFLSSTQNELGTHLEALKDLFVAGQMRRQSAPAKGDEGEAAVANALASFAEARQMDDTVQLVGRTAGALKGNKTGDIVVTVGADDDAPVIVIECKLDKSIRLGNPAADGLTRGKSDTAWSQLIEAKANRNADVAIMVFSADSTDRTIGAFTDSVRYIDGVGYIVLVDIARGDFRPLSIAYELAREQALARRKAAIDSELLNTLVCKLCADLEAASQIKQHLDSAANSLSAASAQVDRALGTANATRTALLSYLQQGRLDGQQMLKLFVPHKAAD